jgi:hypothetical protein
MEDIMKPLVSEMFQDDESVRFNWKSIAYLIKVSCAVALAVIAILTYWYHSNTIILFNSYIDPSCCLQFTPIAPSATALTDTYKNHWQHKNIFPKQCYCTLYLINNSPYCFVNVHIEYTLKVDDDTPLKTDFVQGSITTWTSEINSIDVGKCPPISVIDVSPFYSGLLSWRISADNPQKDNERIVIEEGKYSIDNHQYLTLY